MIEFPGLLPVKMRRVVQWREGGAREKNQFGIYNLV